jgi:hypothetical protein
MGSITPFANETESLAIAGLTIENRTDRVAIYGQIHLTRDKAGLADARALKIILDDVVRALEGQRNLPDKVILANAPRAAKNPFA